MTPSQFKIACLVPPHYDYLASTLIEGLISLGHQCIGIEDSNHVKKLSKSKLEHFLKDCDLIIVFQGDLVDCGLLDTLSPAVKVFVDGSDLPSISEMPNVTFNYVFKRELLDIISHNWPHQWPYLWPCMWPCLWSVSSPKQAQPHTTIQLILQKRI